jgi:hypothetical protein
MTVRIDKSGSDGESRAIELLHIRGSLHLSDRFNAIAGDEHVPGNSRLACAVDNTSISQQPFGFHFELEAGIKRPSILHIK